MSTKTPIDLRYDGSTPCPVCDSNTKGCSHLEDGGQLCRGEPVDPSRWTVTAVTGMDDFKIYRPAKAATSPRGKKDKPTPRINWSAKAVHYASKLCKRSREELASQLGVPTESLALVPFVGKDGDTRAGVVATFPEVDPDGVIVGIVRRDPSQETKNKSMTDADRGLILAAGWDSPPGPVLVVEGATDVIACAAAGLCVVGRPGKDAKIEWLIELCKKLPADRPIIVVGENDQKFNEDGTPRVKDGEVLWPGRTAAIKVANWLAAELPNPVTWALPPADAKDSRGWLTSAAGEWADRGRMYLGHLMAATVPAVKVLPPAEAAARGVDDPDNPDRWAVPFDAPQRLADAYLAAASPPGSPLHLRFWRDEFHEWKAGCYHTIPTGEMRSRVSLFIAAEFERVQKLQLARWKRQAETARFPQAAKVTTSLVTSVVAHLGSLCGVGMTNADAPAWIGDTTGRPPVAEIAAFRNGLLHVTTGRWVAATPEFFNFSTLAFDYDPAAPVPAEWLKFLAETWPDDRQAIDCLQEWFGYLLTPDTRQQKMLWLIGPPRSGKGTTIDVLMSLIGEANVTSPTLQQLAERFGLSPLVNSSVAWFDEPKISRHDNVPAIVGTIKRITGGSRVDIDRKGIPILKNVRLGCRFVLSANEVLELGDASGAMASRVIVISTSVSKIGREDLGLADRLKAVLPGIFNWALAGLPRLHARGRFVQPASGLNDAAQLRDLGSPSSQFLAEMCVFEEGAEIGIDTLFDEFKKWCESENRHAGTKIGFNRDLSSQLPKQHASVRKTVDGKKARFIPGIRLRRAYESDPEPDTTPDPIRSGSPSIWSALDLLGEIAQQGECRAEANNGQNGQSIRSVDRMNGCVRSGENATNPSELPTSGPQDQMNHKSDANIGEGCEVVCAEGEESSLGRNRVLSGPSGPDPADDLYFTTELDLVTYPHNTAAEVLTVGPTTHYRATPSTVITLIAMHDAAPPGPDRDRLAAVLPRLCDYLAAHYSPAEIAAAEAQGARPLPDLRPIPT